MVLVSVIIPVYNKERYLPDAIDSVLKQTYRHFELLLINDNSTDGSRQICENYCQQDNRIKLFDNLSDEHGPGPTRNIGLDQAIGDSILFVDADDWIDEHLIEQCIRRMEETNADAVQYGISIQAKDGIKNNYYFWKGKKVLTREEIIEDPIAFLENLQNSSVTYLYSKKLIGNIRFENVISGEDISFVLDVLSEAQKISFIETPLYFYRYVDGSTSRRWNEESIDCLYNIWKHKMKFIEKLGNSNKNIETEIAYDTCIWAAFQMSTAVCPLTFSQKKKEIKWLVEKINFDSYRKLDRGPLNLQVKTIKHMLFTFRLENVMLLLGPVFLKVARGE